MSYGELEAGLVRENNDLQARLAQCEGEKVALAHDRDNWLYRCHSVEDERTELRAERDAALERVRELEKGLQFIMFHIEAPQDSDIPADQYIPTLSEAVVCRNEIQRLLALRAGSVTNGGSAQQIRREVGS